MSHHHARVEELSDTESEPDPVDMDPSDFDPTRFALSPVQPTTATPKNPTLIDPSSISSQQTQFASASDAEQFKHFQCVYPVYFDRMRSRAEGRRVGKDLAVENPLARDVVDAVQGLGLKALFEPGKLHPKDWSNPGRIKVLVKEDGRQVNGRVNNKHHLYNLIADYLRAHPTTDDSARRLRIPNMPPPDPNKPIPPPAIPRGWKMGSILPLHSPALSGGGVSENFFKEMMAEMQGQGQVEGGGGSDGGAKKKKDKKKGKA